MKNLKPKFPCSLCKGDHFLMDFPSLPKVLEMWSSTSKSPTGHAGDSPSTSDVKVGKKKTIVTFPCMLCECDHYSHLCPRMNEAYSLLEKLQLPTGYHNIFDQVIKLVSSSVEPLTKVVDLVSSLINPTFHLQSETQVTNPIPSLFSPTLHLNSANVVNHTPPLTSAKLVTLFPSSVSPVDHVVNLVTSLVELVDKAVDLFPPVGPILPLENETQAVDLMSLLIDPTHPLEIKPNYAHFFLVDT
jgi:hypothetical protein